MKKSAKVTLTVVAAVGLASCGRSRRDPCEPGYFNDFACQEAVRSGGYYWGGTWYPMVYHYPYPYYYDHYTSYRSGGGTVIMAPSGSYSRPSGSVTSAPSSGGVQRGGFGSTGASHAAGE
jgi:hypothetical protein